jgi:topoisomerase IA-like protein
VLGAARAATLAAEQSKGTIQAMPLDKNELILKDSKGTKMTFFLSKNCKVFINDKEAKLSDLRTGDEASVTYEQQGFVPMVAVEIRCARR